MTNQQLAQVLVEKLANANINKKIAVFVNRLMLRLHSQPALMANLADVVVFKPGIEADTKDQVEDGKFHESAAVVRLTRHGEVITEEASAIYQKLREEATADDTQAANAPDDENAPGKEERDREDKTDGPVVVQLSFRRLPQEIIAPLIRLVAAPRDPKLFRYSKDGSARTGLEMELKPSDFPGDDYDYAF